GSKLRSLRPDGPVGSRGGSLKLSLGGGVVLIGKASSWHALPSHPLLVCDEMKLFQHDRLLAQGDQVALLASTELTEARAGAVDPSYYEATEFSSITAPKPRVFPAEELEMLELYRRARAAHHSANIETMQLEFRNIHARLKADFRHDWLLRWNMLESLIKRGVRGRLVTALCRELTALERHYLAREPIASGLRHLGFD